MNLISAHDKNDYKEKEAQMKQTTQEVITKLTIEYNDLAGRIGSLERFLICEDFPKTSSSQRLLLAQQRTVMEQYKEILLKRLVDLRNQEYQKEEAAKEYVAKHKIPMKAPEDESGTPAD